ncbi:hypothetical protein [uncultured Clostridium sp.]|uniref:hypothetical protein n=1 Tax=uncultured Clostridium sp. TaxID=59620 RepID=UPI0027DD5FD3|nr:hypothetical protein [uncultured Clostridium sp.]
MAEFILEEQIEKVSNPITKEYLREVISSYNNGNYRSAILVLYTTIIYDLLQKLTILKDVYNDDKARIILDSIRNKQMNEPKNPEWEKKLIDEIYNKTHIISAVEKEQLLNIKNERNYVAHPIIDFNSEKLELKSATKETAKDLIRKGFEIVFLKDAILAKNITEDIIYDLNDYYARVNIRGLGIFLKTKYFNRMTKERKDYLFRTLWKLVFITDNDECSKNRESNYWGLYYLYQENKEHYKDLLKEDEHFYFTQLNVETFEYSKQENIYIQIYKYLNSKIMMLIKFVEYNSEIFNVFNEHAKNIIQNTVDSAFIKDNILEMTLDEISKYKEDADYQFKNQLKLEAQALFLSDSITEHFNNINRMISNYCSTRKNWYEPNNYGVLCDDEILNCIFVQSEYRGCIKEFISFLIDYCIGAQNFYQAKHLFRYIKIYSDYFSKDDFYRVLAGINDNDQYYKNDEKSNMLEYLEERYKSMFDCDLIEVEIEKYLYRNLYYFDSKIIAKKCDEILDIVEKRALFYGIYSLWKSFIEPIIEALENNNQHLKKDIKNFPNITTVLLDKKDKSYSKLYIEEFKKRF